MRDRGWVYLGFVLCILKFFGLNVFFPKPVIWDNESTDTDYEI